MADVRRPETGDLIALLRDLAGALFGTDTVLRLVVLGVLVAPVSEAKLRRPGRGDVIAEPPPTLVLRPGRGDFLGEEVKSTLLLFRPGRGDCIETLSAAMLRLDSVLLPAPGRGDRDDAGRDASPPTVGFRPRGVTGAASICFIDSGAEIRRDDLRGDEGTGDGGACSCIDGSSSSSDPDSFQ